MPDSFESQINDHQRVISAMTSQVPVLRRMADRLIDAIEKGGCIYIFGNGGSAADAQHIAAELVGRFKREGRALPAIALTTDTSTLLAVGNDMGFEHVFARQVEALVSKVDIVWALSVSGSSPNVIKAVDAAKEIGATVIGFTGKKGDCLHERCEICFSADHRGSDRVQEAHQLAYHLVCEQIERHYRT